MSYLLDTNICIALLNGKEKGLIDKVKGHAPSDFSLCSIVKGELLYGARKSERVEGNLSLLEGFFAQFNSLPFDDRAAIHYGLLRALLTKEGKPIGANDLLIASIALQNDKVLLTRNRSEFQRIPGLRLEIW